LSNTVFLIIVVGIVLAMLVMMVRYARFIHNYPSQVEKDPGKKDPDSEKSTDETGQEK